MGKRKRKPVYRWTRHYRSAEGVLHYADSVADVSGSRRDELLAHNPPLIYLAEGEPEEADSGEADQQGEAE